MTVLTLTNQILYTADGVQTVFAYDFYVIEQEHMFVRFDGVNQPSGWTVEGVGDPLGGTVTFAAPPAAGVEVLLIRIVPFTQQIDYTEYDPFPAEVAESALDLEVMRDQQLVEVQTRALFYAAGDQPAGGTQLPAPVAGLVIGYDGAGELANLSASGAGVVPEAPPGPDSYVRRGDETWQLAYTQAEADALFYSQAETDGLFAPLTHVGATGAAEHGVVTVSEEGFAPILPNDDTQYLDGTGNWTVPPGSGGGGGVIAGPQFVVGDLVEVTTSTPATIQSNGIDSDRVLQMPTPGEPAAGTLPFFRGSGQVMEYTRIGSYALGATPSDDIYNLANVEALDGNFAGTLSENNNRVYSAANPPPGLAGTINTVRLNSGADVSVDRARLNFIEGTGVTIEIVDDGTGNEADITISTAAGSGDVVQAGTGANQDFAFWSDFSLKELDGITIADGGLLSKQSGTLTVVAAGTTGQALVAGAPGAVPAYAQLTSAAYGPNTVSDLALADMGAFTLKGNNTSGTNNPVNFTIGSLSTNSSGTGFVLSTGALGTGPEKVDIASLGGGAGTGDVIQSGTGVDNGVAIWDSFSGNTLTGTLEVPDGGLLTKESGAYAVVVGGATGYPLVSNGPTVGPSYQVVTSVGLGPNSVTRAKMEQMPAYSMLGQPGAGSQDPSFITEASLSLVSAAAGQTIQVWEAVGNFAKVDVADLLGGGAGNVTSAGTTLDRIQIGSAAAAGIVDAPEGEWDSVNSRMKFGGVELSELTATGLAVMDAAQTTAATTITLDALTDNLVIASATGGITLNTGTPADPFWATIVFTDAAATVAFGTGTWYGAAPTGDVPAGAGKVLSVLWDGTSGKAIWVG